MPVNEFYVEGISKQEYLATFIETDHNINEIKQLIKMEPEKVFQQKINTKIIHAKLYAKCNGNYYHIEDIQFR